MSTPLTPATIAEARRQGAEWMRERAMKVAASERELATAQCSLDPARFDYWDARRAQAKTLERWIAGLDLPVDGPPLLESRVTLLTQQVVDVLNDCDHGGGGSPAGCVRCESMLAVLREAGVEVARVSDVWPYWRLKS